jgi:hypothetical protein
MHGGLNLSRALSAILLRRVGFWPNHDILSHILLKDVVDFRATQFPMFVSMLSMESTALVAGLHCIGLLECVWAWQDFGSIVQWNLPAARRLW